MPYICRDCENKTEFKQTVWGTCRYTETDYLDENNNVDDSSGSDYDDHDQTDSDAIECRECDSSNVVDVTQSIWDAWEGPGTADEHDDWDFATETISEITDEEIVEEHSWKERYARKAKQEE